MYNLIVSGDPEAWIASRSSLSFLRLFEHTAEPLKERYRPLNDTAVAELTSFPTLFAYEDPRGLPARVGKVTRIRHSSGPEVRFEFEFFDGVPPIPSEELSALAWDLDINDWELNRTHWAVKDVDLLEVLRGAQRAGSLAAELPQSPPVARPPAATLVVEPKVFSVPQRDAETDLAAVMMPFSREFDAVYAAVQRACAAAALRCERADDVWEESTIIQDVFNLIYRSAVVVVDLSGRNSNVLYETGIAHTLGRDVVPITRDVSNLPFDLAHHRVLPYLPNSEGLDDMAQKLERKLRSLTA